jgi:RimJ/RimL family protein N-acetyltransferase
MTTRKFSPNIYYNLGEYLNAWEKGDSKVIGTFYFIQGNDIEPTYREIENGAWIDESSYGVVHRLASDGSEKGIGRYCLDWAFKQCGHLRVDTHTDNKVMQNLLTKNGFIKCGIIHVVEDNYPRYAYEKTEKLFR